jgi:serine/threonine protein kinase
VSDQQGETPKGSEFPARSGAGASTNTGQMPRVGAEFASYRIQGVLGRGGMSVVYRADNPRLGNEVALKVLSLELSENDAFRERFVRESRLAASINHPNIIPIYDAGEDDGLLYIVMRYVEGADLKTLIRQEGPLSLRRTADIISQVARGLSVAHQRGLVHRDIKPANILTEQAGAAGQAVDHAYLADFGLMKHLDSRSGLTDTGQFLGTVDYVAPEQVEGRATDHRADIYSLGCVVYECLTGAVPYQRDADVAVLFAHVQDPVPRVTDLRSDLAPAVDEIVARAMAKRPERRYADATDFSRELLEAVGASRYSHERPISAPMPIAAATPPDESGPIETPPPPTGPEVAARGGAPGEPPAGGHSPPDGEQSLGGGPSMPARARRSLLVTGLAIALLVAIGVIGFQLVSGGSSTPSAGSSGSSSSSSNPPSSGASTSLTGPTKASDLRLVMPVALYSHCTPAPPAGVALASLDCSTKRNGLTFQVSLYPNTSDLTAAYQRYVTAQGALVKPNPAACTTSNWSGERVWLHPTGSQGGRVACYLDPTGDSVIVWMHMSKNQKGVPPQTDHRDVLVVARQHTQLPGDVLNFWNFWGGEKGTAAIIGKVH